ncbi:ABC transporter permease [Corynebacterium kutscheri]
MMKNLLRFFSKYLITLIVASLLIFFLLRVAPGDPAAIALGVTATEESLAALREQMGLNRPLIIQYFDWIYGLLRGDFGISLTSQTEISDLIIDRMQVSLILVLCSLAFALTIAIPFGLWAARRANHSDGVVVSILSQLGIAVPSFLAAILLVILFSIHLGWLPPGGWVVPKEDPAGFIQRLILPVVSLGIVQAAILTRYIRSAVLDVMNEDFIRTARAKGLSPARALRAHGLRNAALPVITILGIQLTGLIIGAVIIEKVFVLPGIGTMLLTAVTNRDLPTVQTIVMLLVVFAVILNALIDAIYVVIDPRIRNKEKAHA